MDKNQRSFLSDVLLEFSGGNVWVRIVDLEDLNKKEIISSTFYLKNEQEKEFKEYKLGDIFVLLNGESQTVEYLTDVAKNILFLTLMKGHFGSLDFQ